MIRMVLSPILINYPFTNQCELKVVFNIVAHTTCTSEHNHMRVTSLIPMAGLLSAFVACSTKSGIFYHMSDVGGYSEKVERT